jgi:hypothetical protein
MELGLLVTSRILVCLVQPETLSSVYVMICAPYETIILFNRELHGTASLSKVSLLGLSCAPETLSSFYIFNCAPYETWFLFYRELNGTLSVSKLSSLGLACATWNAFFSVLHDWATYETGILFYRELHGNGGVLVNSRTWVCFVHLETLSSVYLMICAPYETGILF